LSFTLQMVLARQDRDGIAGLLSAEDEPSGAGSGLSSNIAADGNDWGPEAAWTGAATGKTRAPARTAVARQKFVVVCAKESNSRVRAWGGLTCAREAPARNTAQISNLVPWRSASRLEVLLKRTQEPTVNPKVRPVTMREELDFDRAHGKGAGKTRKNASAGAGMT
jgi:hypothetical protein